MKVICVSFHRHVNFGGSHKVDGVDLRGKTPLRAMVEGLEYDPATGEVVIHVNVRCPLTAQKGGRIRVPASNVAHVLEDTAPVAAPVKGKADKTGLVTA